MCNLLCIESVLTDCICAAIETITSAGLLKSDIQFEMLVAWPYFLVACGLGSGFVGACLNIWWFNLQRFCSVLLQLQEHGRKLF